MPQRIPDEQNVYDPWIAWTPQIDQGATTNITKTVDVARYKKIGKTVTAYIKLTLTGAGTTNNPVKVSQPIAALTGFSLHGQGNCMIRDASAGADYRGIVAIENSGFFSFRRPDSTLQVDIGVDPNFALASGDLIFFNVTYEIP